MTNLDDFRQTLAEIQKENPDIERLQLWFLGSIAATSAAMLDILEEMTNGNKL